MRILLWIFLSAGMAAQAGAAKLNVVFILVDDWGWTDAEVQGSDFFETPNIDRLAREGMRFTQAYAAAAICSPTRAAILTGKSPARLDMTIWHEGAVRGGPKSKRLLEAKAQPNEENSLDDLLNRMDEAMNEGAGSTTEEGISAAKEKIAETQSKLQENQSGLPTQGGGANRNTTIKYRLVNRSALALPNPVYTCEGGGTVVINITVNDRGQVVNAAYNAQRSSTTNGCLIDSALEYAQVARFTSKAGKTSQLGTITYRFPGQ
mgnify:CR=1 FL=1